MSPLLAQGPAASFDIASIKPSASGTRQRVLIEPGGRFFAEGVSLKLLIAGSWHLASYQIYGGENWTASEPWTVDATAEGIRVPSWTPPFFPEIIAARIRSLVLERFALQTHHETREPAVWMDRPVIDKTRLTGHVDVKLRFAPENAPRPSQVQPSPEGAVPPPSDDPSIFTAVEEQLGLKLEAAREPIDVLVIDSARRPTAN